MGFVFGELTSGEVDVRIWIHPEHRKKGYGTAALRKSRSEIAAYFRVCRWWFGRWRLNGGDLVRVGALSRPAGAARIGRRSREFGCPRR